jgi:AhpC/TSA family
MNSGLLVSQLALWLLMAFLYLAVLMMYRRFGEVMLSGRDARGNQGPAAELQMDSINVTDISAFERTLGRPRKDFQLIFVSSVLCKQCKVALPYLSAFAEQHSDELETILVCHGDGKSAKEFVKDLARNIHVVLDPKRKVAPRLRINNTPFAVLVDREGVVRGKGLAYVAKHFQWFSKRMAEQHSKIPLETLTNSSLTKKGAMPDASMAKQQIG